MRRRCFIGLHSSPLNETKVLRRPVEVTAENGQSPMGSLVGRVCSVAAFRSAHSNGVRGPPDARRALQRRAQTSGSTLNRVRAPDCTSVSFKPQRLHRCLAVNFVQEKVTMGGKSCQEGCNSSSHLAAGVEATAIGSAVWTLRYRRAQS
jgi:hypothetical protein